MSQRETENLFLRILAVPFLVVLGLAFGAAAFVPGWRAFIDEWIGGVNFVYIGVGFLFFYTAVLVAEKNLMRRKFIGLLEEIQRFFYGADHRQFGEAVEILIRAVEKGEEKTARTAVKELKRLTGQDFGTDHAQWAAWWRENRERFMMARRKASMEKERTTHGSHE